MACYRVAVAIVSVLPSVTVVGAMRQIVSQKGSCNTLTQTGSFATVELSVGSPPQKLQVVADTGSDLVLVESCACEENGGCTKDSSCYKGEDGKSVSFASQASPRKVTITYGSGPITTLVATDDVRLGNISARMEDSLMMITKNELRSGIQLEGILGLGMPHNKNSISKELGFLDRAKVERLSMCFNGGKASDGLLRLGKAGYVHMDKPLAGVGKKHWSIGLPGVGIGQDSLTGESVFRADNSALVDSGTTLILGPEEDIVKLLAGICDAWPRCQKSSSLLQYQVNEDAVRAKAKALYTETADCKLDGMPSLFFQVRGEDGTEDSLEMTPDDYMWDMSIRLKVAANLFDSREQPTGTVCKPAIDLRKVKPNTSQYILGSPFFYKYVVAYDRQASPPALSFNRAECGSCAGSTASSFLASSSHSKVFVRRQLHSEPREGTFEE